MSRPAIASSCANLPLRPPRLKSFISGETSIRLFLEKEKIIIQVEDAGILFAP